MALLETNSTNFNGLCPVRPIWRQWAQKGSTNDLENSRSQAKLYAWQTMFITKQPTGPDMSSQMKTCTAVAVRPCKQCADVSPNGPVHIYIYMYMYVCIQHYYIVREWDSERKRERERQHLNLQNQNIWPSPKEHVVVLQTSQCYVNRTLQCYKHNYRRVTKQNSLASRNWA